MPRITENTIFRNKTDYGFKEIYKHYKEEGGTLERGKFKEVLGELNNRYINHVIKGHTWIFPFRLGNLKCRRKRKNLVWEGKINKRVARVDWKKSYRIWEKMWPDKTSAERIAMKDKPLAHLTNENSAGDGLKFYWRKYVSFGLKNYCLMINQKHRKSLVKYVQENGASYHFK